MAPAVELELAHGRWALLGRVHVVIERLLRRLLLRQDNDSDVMQWTFVAVTFDGVVSGAIDISYESEDGFYSCRCRAA